MPQVRPTSLDSKQVARRGNRQGITTTTQRRPVGHRPQVADRDADRWQHSPQCEQVTRINALFRLKCSSLSPYPKNLLPLPQMDVSNWYAKKEKYKSVKFSCLKATVIYKTLTIVAFRRQLYEHLGIAINHFLSLKCACVCASHLLRKIWFAQITNQPRKV